MAPWKLIVAKLALPFSCLKALANTEFDRAQNPCGLIVLSANWANATVMSLSTTAKNDDKKEKHFEFLTVHFDFRWKCFPGWWWKVSLSDLETHTGAGIDFLLQ